MSFEMMPFCTQGNVAWAEHFQAGMRAKDTASPSKPLAGWRRPRTLCSPVIQAAQRVGAQEDDKGQQGDHKSGLSLQEGQGKESRGGQHSEQTTRLWS
jgi:hypothetical protein